MSVPNTLADIRLKVRRLTARSQQTQIPDATIDQYINTYYLYDMPESLRMLKLKDTLSFTTVPNQESYNFDNTTWITCEGPAYCGGQEMQLFQDPTTFYRQSPKVNYIQQINAGNGTSGPYSGTIGPQSAGIAGTPFLRSVNVIPNDVNGNPIIGATPIQISRTNNVFFYAVSSPTNASITTVSTVQDDGWGNIIDPEFGTVLGSINYVTGAYHFVFTADIPAGNIISCATIPFVPALPRCVMFFSNNFFMRPIPDNVYEFQIRAFRFPTAFISSNPGQQPELAQWWQLLAYGAARKILLDNGDTENARALEPDMQEQLLYCERRTIKQQSTQRVQTIYSQQDFGNWGSGFPYYL